MADRNEIPSYISAERIAEANAELNRLRARLGAPLLSRDVAVSLQVKGNVEIVTPPDDIPFCQGDRPSLETSWARWQRENGTKLDFDAAKKYEDVVHSLSRFGLKGAVYDAALTEAIRQIDAGERYDGHYWLTSIVDAVVEDAAPE